MAADWRKWSACLVAIAFLAGCGKQTERGSVAKPDASLPFVIFDRSEPEYEYALMVDLPEIVVQQVASPSVGAAVQYRLVEATNELVVACQALREAEGIKEGMTTFAPPGPWYCRYLSGELVFFPDEDSQQIREWAGNIRGYVLKRGQKVDRLPEWVTRNQSVLRLVTRPVAPSSQPTTQSGH